MNRKTLLAVLVPALITVSATDAAAARPDLKVRALTAALDAGSVLVDATLGATRTDVAYYLSTDAKLDKRDRLLARKRAKGRHKVTAELPSGMAPGSYRVIACVDVKKKVRERNERNNCKAIAIVIPGPSLPSPPRLGDDIVTPPAKDATAPDTTITAGPEGTTASRAASFAFASTEAGSSFECKIDGGTFAPCGSPKDVADLADGAHAFAVRATDRAGNTDSTPATRNWNVAAGDGPHSGPTDPPAEHPAEEAGPLPATGTVTMGEATEFLYTGPDPIQKEVEEGAIEEKRVAVLRGRVLNRMGGGIAGVRVTVLGHPELGRTATRADGGFDLAVNGGGAVVLEYARAGWMPVQRAVQAPWQDYTSVEDVVMAPYDDAVTEIDLGSAEAVQVHQASPVNDGDGRRRSVLMFSAGTDAEMVLPDGSTVPLDTLDVRATEYTVGENGREAMPGALPPSSGYTYAVELSVDQAIEAGATEVRFDQPVINYVDNFLQFPVGGPVPTGYYDREAGRWVAAPDGRVIAIVSETDGKADVDVDGDGTADRGAKLEALKITDAERERLAGQYDAGKSLWRVPIEHFTPWDHNWPYAPPADSVPPRVPVPNEDKAKPKKECWVPGSIIGCETQRLGETLGVTGTPYNLRYWSDRTPGYLDEDSLNVPLVPNEVPSGLQRVLFQVEIAGQRYEKSYAPAPNLKHDFVWDGKDAYGRTLKGAQPVTVRIGYQYGLVAYSSPVAWGQAFGRLSGTGLTLNAASQRMDVTVWREYRDETQTMVGGFDARDQALGGWTLDAHHWFDARAHTVHLGGGGRLNADPVITTAAGNGKSPVIPRQGDGQPGPSVPLGDLGEAEVGPDGTVYFAEITTRNDGSLVGAVRMIEPDGHVRTLATNLGATIGIGVSDDGTVYVAESIQHRVKRITPDGQVFPFAGGGTSEAEGIPATSAKLSFPSDVAVAQDGSVYIAEQRLGGGGTVDNGIVSHVGPDGLMSTVAGGGNELGDGGPATQAKLASASGIAVDADGLLVIATKDRIRRLDAGGRITTIAGGGDPENGNGDGGPALEARIDTALAVDVMSDGGVAFTDGNRVRRITPDGQIHRVAGGGSGDLGDGGPAAQAVLSLAGGVAVAPDNSFYVTTDGSELNSGRIRKVARPLVKQHGGSGIVPSSDGASAYEFDERGRHLRTLDGLTGDVRLTFGYDTADRLTSITDADGNVTAIERETDGRPKAIVAPGGQRTTLTVGGSGYLERVENPAGEATKLEYKPDGLLEKLTDRRGGLHEFTYTQAGRLATDRNPELGLTKLDLEPISSGYKVTKTSTLGRKQTFSLQRRLDGVLMETTTATGAKTTVLTRADGNQIVTYPDGTKVEVHREPDPQWGFSAPRIAAYKVTTPEGRVDETTIQRNTVLADGNDPLSVMSMTETTKTGNRTMKTVFDAEARTIATTSAKGRTTTTTLDDDGAIARIDRPGQDAMVIARDAKGRLDKVVQGSQSRTYEYDAKGRVKARTDAADKRTEYGYDDADRLISVKRPSGRTYGFAYDAGGTPRTVTMPDGDVHELGHNGLDQLERFQPAGSTAAQTREYDRDHALEQVTLAGGRTISTGRSAQTGRVTGQGYAEAQVAFGFADATDRLSSMSWDGPGNAAAEELAFTYDGQMPKSATATGTAAGRYDYSYGAGQLMSNVKLTSGSTTLDTAYVRDDDGLVTGLGPFTLTRSSHDAALKIAEGLSFNHDLTFDGRRRLATRTVKIGAQQPYKAELTRNVRGQIERKVETLGATVTDWRYEYDGDGRLLIVRKDGTVVEEYGYDDNGNRRTRQINGGAVEQLTYDGQERLASRGATAYGFDADGMLATRGADAFTYSARGELLRAEAGGTIVTYTYDGLGRRVSRTQGTAVTQYLYGNPADPFQVTAVRDGAGVLTAYYYDEAGHLFAMRRGTTRFYIATDQVGTPRVVTAANGTVVKSLTFDAFGVPTGDSAPAVELPFGFAGGLADPVTGLVRFGLRDYEPAAGRWTARDPALFSGGQANLYDYVGSDPIAHRDPSGLICIGGAVYAGFGGGGQFCINDEGFSLCAEAGFGVGNDFGIEGGLAEDGETIVAEVEAQLGIAKAKIGVELDNTGCLSVTPFEGKLTDGLAVKLNTDGDLGFLAEPPLEIKNGPEELLKLGKVKLTAKVAAKFCRRALW